MRTFASTTLRFIYVKLEKCQIVELYVGKHAHVPAQVHTRSLVHFAKNCCANVLLAVAVVIKTHTRRNMPSSDNIV